MYVYYYKCVNADFKTIFIEFIFIFIFHNGKKDEELGLRHFEQIIVIQEKHLVIKNFIPVVPPGKLLVNKKQSDIILNKKLYYV